MICPIGKTLTGTTTPSQSGLAFRDIICIHILYIYILVGIYIYIVSLFYINVNNKFYAWVFVVIIDFYKKNGQCICWQLDAPLFSSDTLAGGTGLVTNYPTSKQVVLANIVPVALWETWHICGFVVQRAFCHTYKLNVFLSSELLSLLAWIIRQHHLCVILCWYLFTIEWFQVLLYMTNDLTSAYKKKKKKKKKKPPLIYLYTVK